jgi:hypothetical protein
MRELSNKIIFLCFFASVILHMTIAESRLIQV